MTSFVPALNPSGANTREISERVNRLLAGKLNSRGEVTLTSGTQTALDDPNIGLDSVILFSPKTASASGVAVWYQITASGSVTLNHAVGGSARTFGYVVIG